MGIISSLDVKEESFSLINDEIRHGRSFFGHDSVKVA